MIPNASDANSPSAIAATRCHARDLDEVGARSSNAELLDPAEAPSQGGHRILGPRKSQCETHWCFGPPGIPDRDPRERSVHHDCLFHQLPAIGDQSPDFQGLLPAIGELLAVRTRDCVRRRSELGREHQMIIRAGPASPAVQPPLPTIPGRAPANVDSEGTRSRLELARGKPRHWKAQERSRMRLISPLSSSDTGQANSRPTRKCDRSAVSLSEGTASISWSVKKRSVVIRSRCVSM